MLAQVPEPTEFNQLLQRDETTWMNSIPGRSSEWPEKSLLAMEETQDVC